MKTKKPILLLLTFLIIPLVSAEECGITNLATCIPEKLFEYILTLINTPFQSLLELTKNLLTEPVNLNPYMPIWAIIIYIISIFYGLFILLAGFNFLISGYSAEKRETAKEWLKNTVLMILFVEASFYLYQLAIDASSNLTTGMMNMIDPSFFMLTMDNYPTIAMELAMSIPYLISLLACVIWLTVRYILVAIGVLFFPIGIFLNFIPPVKGYGKLIINSLMILIFLPFFQCLIMLGSSLLIDIPLFDDFKFLLMIATFFLISFCMLALWAFAVIKAAFSSMSSPAGRAAKLMVTKL